MPESKFKAIVNARCPRCRNGSMFRYPVYNLGKFGKMNDTCPECGQRFDIEPGFYIGAMYVSYALSVFILVVEGSLFFLLIEDPPVWIFAVAGLISIVVLHPLIFRYSRVLYLHLFGGIPYQGNGDK